MENPSLAETSNKSLLLGILLLCGFSILSVFLLPWPYHLFLLGALVVMSTGLLACRYLFIFMFMILPFSFEVDVSFISGLNLALPTELLMPLIAGMILFHLILKNQLTWHSSPLNLAVGIYIFVLLLSGVTSNYPLIFAKTGARSLGYIFTGFFVTRYLITRKIFLQFVLASMLVTSVGLVFYGFYTQLEAGVAVYQDIALPFFKNHCIYAEFLCIVFAFLFAFNTVKGKLKGRTFIVLLSLLFACAILMTFVRGAWMALIGLFFFIWWMRGREVSGKMIALLTVLMIAAAGFALSFDLIDLLNQRIENLLHFKYVTNFDRIDRWMAAFLMGKDNPILGVGYGNYPEVYYKYIWYIKSTTITDRMGAHNLFLEIFAETGIVGLFAFLGMIWVFFREGYKLSKKITDPFLSGVNLGTMGAMVTFLIHGIVNNLGPSDKLELLFWTLIGMPIVIKQINDLKTPQKEDFIK